MNRCDHVAWIACCLSATACSMGQRNDDRGAVESDPEWLKPKKDAATPDSPPPPPPDSPPPPPDSPPPPTPGFIDACLLPGMTLAAFNPTLTFDANDEGVTAVLDLPFSFTFYGTAHTKFWITTNGQLGFGPTLGGSDFGQATCPLPNSRFTTPIVLVYSTDLIGRIASEGGGVCYATTGTAPSRKLVVTWKDSFFYDAWTTSHATFSAMLNEGTNIIDVVIERADAPFNTYFETGSGSVLGVQSGSSAQTFSCYQPLAPEGTVIHYGP